MPVHGFRAIRRSTRGYNLTPLRGAQGHGAGTDECFEDIARTALRSIADVSLGRKPRHMVNPEAGAGLG